VTVLLEVASTPEDASSARMVRDSLVVVVNAPVVLRKTMLEGSETSTNGEMVVDASAVT
jgi:hypothetical protein